jgi:heat shock protein HtpX
MGHKHYNGLKTALLFGVMWAALLGIGWVLGGGTAQYVLWFAGLGLVMTAVSYWKSDTIAIRARPVSEAEQPAMYRIVRELSMAARQPMPRLFVSPTAAPNAFATGRSPAKAAVCCTEGILGILDERELRGVLGHELMHVYNRDILTSSIAAAIAGVITSLAQIAFWFGGSDRDRNPLGGLLLVLLAPLAAGMIQLAISRTREFDADEDGARLTGDPLALASALRKLESGTKARPLPQDRELVDVSHLMIANPFKAEGMAKMFSTHPPMAERIARLEAQAGPPGGITRY